MADNSTRTDDIFLELSSLYTRLPDVRSRLTQVKRTLTVAEDLQLELLSAATLGAALDLADGVRAVWLSSLGCRLANDVCSNDPAVVASVQQVFVGEYPSEDEVFNELVSTGSYVLWAASSQIATGMNPFESMDRATQRQYATVWLSLISHLTQLSHTRVSTELCEREVESLRLRVLPAYEKLDLAHAARKAYDPPQDGGACWAVPRRQPVVDKWDCATAAEHLFFDCGVSTEAIVRAAFAAANIDRLLATFPLSQWIFEALTQPANLSLQSRETLQLVQLFLRPARQMQRGRTKAQSLTALRGFELDVDELARVSGRPELAALWRAECADGFAALESAVNAESTK